MKKRFRLLRELEFSNESSSMSVVIEDEAGDCFVYCKGSPKLIERRSQNWSLPADYQEKVIDVCRDGLRLLSFGFKQVSKEIVFKASRKELESKLGRKNMIIML